MEVREKQLKKVSKKKSGFTLIELLTVLVILAVIAMIAIPAVLRFTNQTENRYYKTLEGNFSDGPN